MSFLKKNKIFAAVIIGLMGWASVACSQQYFSKDLVLSQILAGVTTRYHYEEKAIDNAFSRKAFDGVFESFDPSKRFFTQSDIETLSTYKVLIDDEFSRGTVNFFDEMSGIYKIRVEEFAEFSKAYLANPVPLKTQQKVELDPKKRQFAQDSTAQKEVWKELLLHQVQLSYIDLLNKDEKLKKKLPQKLVTIDSKIEKKAREKVLKDVKQFVSNLLKDQRKDLIARYYNSLVSQWDPHTTYLPPEDRENFDISMSGKLEGIGAVLKEEDGFIKVSSIVVGGPAWRQKELKANDAIIKVAQGDRDFLDITGMRVNEAVKYIRGKKGTLVRLMVRKTHNEVVTIPIIRDVVELDDTYAKSAVLTTKKKDLNVGYIFLPVFYHDFNGDEQARNAADDVKAELLKLKTQNVAGIVLDLRNNSGGALDDAVRLSGLFFEKGPVVQVYPRDKKFNVLNDEDSDITYSGPVVILINEWSASASEIVAAALQDYKRAVIVGSKHSFGKGTVQTLASLDEQVPVSAYFAKPLGSIKLTIQKFYRVNGGSTQYNGVVSDIVLPDTSEGVTTGERILPNALGWDTVPSLSYQIWGDPPNIERLKEKSQKRLRTDPVFSKITKIAEVVAETRKETQQLLDVNDIWLKQKKLKDAEEKMKKASSARLMITPTEKKVLEKEDLEKQKEWFKILEKDAYLQECVAIIQDIVKKDE